MVDISEKITDNILIYQSFNQLIIFYFHFWFTEEYNFFLCTIKRNGLKNVKLPDDKVSMQKPRGTAAHSTTSLKNTKITAVV